MKKTAMEAIQEERLRREATDDNAIWGEEDLPTSPEDIAVKGLRFSPEEEKRFRLFLQAHGLKLHEDAYLLKASLMGWRKFKEQYEPVVRFPGETPWEAIVSHHSLDIEEEDAFREYIEMKGHKRMAPLDLLEMLYYSFTSEPLYSV